MNFAAVIGGVLLGCLLWSFLSNFWFRFKWCVLGIKPDILLEDQLSLAVSESAKHLAEEMNGFADRMLEASDFNRSVLRHTLKDFTEEYTRSAIECYIHLFKLPRLTRLRNVGVPRQLREGADEPAKVDAQV